jgi:hypothetical protein
MDDCMLIASLIRCAPRMIELGLFPSAKELTQSFACFNAVRLADL